MAARFGASDQPPRESRAAPDPASDAALRSLGYVGGRSVARRTGPPPDPKTMMDVHRGVERGEGLLHARDFVGAQRELRAVLDRDPENVAALEDTATALAELGRFDSAEGALKRALEIAPDRASLHLAMAQIEGAQGDWKAALTRADAASALAPDDPAVLAVRAQALDRLGRAADARAALDRALAIAPGDPLLAVRYVEIVELPGRRYGDAEQRLLRAVAEQPYLATRLADAGTGARVGWTPRGRPRRVSRWPPLPAARRHAARRARTTAGGVRWRGGALASGAGHRALADAGARGPQRVGRRAGVEWRERGRRRAVDASRARHRVRHVARGSPPARHRPALARPPRRRRVGVARAGRGRARSRSGVAGTGGGGARPQGLERRGGGGAPSRRPRPRSRHRMEHPGDRDRGDRRQSGGGAALPARGGRPAHLLAGEPQSRSGAAGSGPLRRGGPGLRGGARDRSRARQVALRARSALRRPAGRRRSAPASTSNRRCGSIPRARARGMRARRSRGYRLRTGSRPRSDRSGAAGSPPRAAPFRSPRRSRS